MEAILSELAKHKEQLAQVQQAMLLVQDPASESASSLLTLEADLKEFIELMEDELKTMQRNEADGSCNETEVYDGKDSLAPSTNYNSNITAATSSTNDVHADSDDADVDDEMREDALESLLDSLVGMQCRAPYDCHLGHQSSRLYHNAVIAEVCDIGEMDKCDDIGLLKVTVFFCNPLNNGMRPCQYYLDDKCNYSTEQCRFSHGETVLFRDLLEYEEVEHSQLIEGATVLAKKSNDLWEGCRLGTMCTDEGKAVVKSLETGKEEAVSFEHIAAFPTGNEESRDNAGCSHLSSENEPVYGSSKSAKVDVDYPSASNDPVSHMDSGVRYGSLGSWEQHTKGIGSLLMAKMGYVPGMGLGKQGQGRVGIIEARVLPKGKTLDACMKSKDGHEKKDSLRQIRKQRRLEKSNQAKIAAGYHRLPRKTIFDFINNKLKSHNQQHLKPLLDGHLVDQPSGDLKDETHSVSSRKLPSGLTSDFADHNLKLFKLEEERKRTLRELQSLKESLARNEGRDAVIANQIKSKIAATENTLSSLKEQGKHVTLAKQKKEGKKKSVIF